jgi:hypothetical protein
VFRGIENNGCTGRDMGKVRESAFVEILSIGNPHEMTHHRTLIR